MRTRALDKDLKLVIRLALWFYDQASLADCSTEPKMVSGTFVLKTVRSHGGTFVLGTIRSQERILRGTFVPWTICCRRLPACRQVMQTPG